MRLAAVAELDLVARAAMRAGDQQHGALMPPRSKVFTVRFGAVIRHASVTSSRISAVCTRAITTPTQPCTPTYSG